MANSIDVNSPLHGVVDTIEVAIGDTVQQGDALLVLEVMNVHSEVLAPTAGSVAEILVTPAKQIREGQVLLRISPSEQSQNYLHSAQLEFDRRDDATQDAARPAVVQKRHTKGYRTARENLADLCNPVSFIEYGQFAVAAQRGRKDYKELQTETAADGIITGVGSINSELFPDTNTQTALVINDYTVLAGTQGYFHHQKLDRILAVAQQQRLPVIMFTEGGGGRPGDTDITTVNSGLQCDSFASWAALQGSVPRIAVANGYNFAGNAALFGAADITIATAKSWIGMAGPAMIAGGGLGDFAPTEIGPIDVQSQNGVVDLVADDEAHACELAKQCVALFQGDLSDWSAPDQQDISACLPDNRRLTYQVRDIIKTLADTNTFIELKANFGGTIVAGFMRMQGKTVGLIANDCNVLGGAIDVDAGSKAADFLRLCDNFNIPILSLCDTPGFMVGPSHEELGAVRNLAKLFTAGAKLKVPLVAIVLRKCYGLGAQAMVGGSTSRPVYTAAWPTGEFGPMGLEGAVQLGFKKELEAVEDLSKRQHLFDKLLAQAYERGQAIEVASVLEIDAVIDPASTRDKVIAAFASPQTQG